MMPTADSALLEADRHVFSLGLDDSAARLGAANMAYGMAKINHVLGGLGYEPDTTFIATPDLTITRNTNRWHSGFGYGGKLEWGDGDRQVLILDVKPNACGMLVGGLSEMPRPQAVVERLAALQTRATALMGVEVTWDFDRGNHFIDLCRVDPVAADMSLPPYAFVMHGSCPELEQETSLGPGTYWDRSEALRRQARLCPTPWGDLHVLLDEQVPTFLGFWDTVDRFAKERRLIAARHCFGEFATIANTTHQGLHGPNCILLGCQDTQDPAAPLLPIMVRSDLPGYLFAGLPNLSPEALAAQGFAPRAEELGVLQRLRAANVIPHGAGYAIPHLRDVLRVIEVADRRYFEMTTADNQATEIIHDLHDVQQKYRGRQPVLKALECGLGRLVAKLTPVHVVKV
jgi:hypothetical protein